eukprot:TRINITY_DN1418_c0_g3_i2.p1 TRINITY_DN1418_c0_g3~~TRINITY_DN1418_c0_g3_i2.p1  ORF type:complete len:1264 (-),score=353.16 TRINITY_DN1418_c0_g3_i2:1687-5088(-)
MKLRVQQRQFWRVENETTPGSSFQQTGLDRNGICSEDSESGREGMSEAGLLLNVEQSDGNYEGGNVGDEDTESDNPKGFLMYNPVEYPSMSMEALRYIVNGGAGGILQTDFIDQSLIHSKAGSFIFQELCKRWKGVSMVRDRRGRSAVVRLVLLPNEQEKIRHKVNARFGRRMMTEMQEGSRKIDMRESAIALAMEHQGDKRHSVLAHERMQLIVDYLRRKPFPVVSDLRSHILHEELRQGSLHRIDRRGLQSVLSLMEEENMIGLKESIRGGKRAVVVELLDDRGYGRKEEHFHLAQCALRSGKSFNMFESKLDDGEEHVHGHQFRQPGEKEFADYATNTVRNGYVDAVCLRMWILHRVFVDFALNDMSSQGKTDLESDIVDGWDVPLSLLQTGIGVREFLQVIGCPRSLPSGFLESVFSLSNDHILMQDLAPEMRKRIWAGQTFFVRRLQSVIPKMYSMKLIEDPKLPQNKETHIRVVRFHNIDLSQWLVPMDDALRDEGDSELRGVLELFSETKAEWSIDLFREKSQIDLFWGAIHQHMKYIRNAGWRFVRKSVRAEFLLFVRRSSWIEFSPSHLLSLNSWDRSHRLDLSMISADELDEMAKQSKTTRISVIQYVHRFRPALIGVDTFTLLAHSRSEPSISMWISLLRIIYCIDVDGLVEQLLKDKEKHSLIATKQSLLFHWQLRAHCHRSPRVLDRLQHIAENIGCTIHELPPRQLTLALLEETESSSSSTVMTETGLSVTRMPFSMADDYLLVESYATVQSLMDVTGIQCWTFVGRLCRRHALSVQRRLPLLMKKGVRDPSSCDTSDGYMNPTRVLDTSCLMKEMKSFLQGKLETGDISKGADDLQLSVDLLRKEFAPSDACSLAFSEESSVGDDGFRQLSAFGNINASRGKDSQFPKSPSISVAIVCDLLRAFFVSNDQDAVDWKSFLSQIDSHLLDEALSFLASLGILSQVEFVEASSSLDPSSDDTLGHFHGHSLQKRHHEMAANVLSSKDDAELGSFKPVDELLQVDLVDPELAGDDTRLLMDMVAMGVASVTVHPSIVAAQMELDPPVEICRVSLDCALDAQRRPLIEEIETSLQPSADDHICMGLTQPALRRGRARLEKVSQKGKGKGKGHGFEYGSGQTKW